MSTFNASEHPRSEGGRFTTVTRSELALALAPRRHQLNGAMSTIRECWDRSDPWGSGMNALGAVEDALARIHGEHSPAGEDGSLADELVEEARRGTLSVADLSRAARALDRYVDLAAAAGLGGD